MKEIKEDKTVSSMDNKLRLGSNMPHNIYDHDDLLGVTPKAKFIINLLTWDLGYLNSNQMFAIYGEWGSGKTSFADLIQKSLETDVKIPTVKLETWEHEIDGNLALSLLNLLKNKLKSTQIEKHKSVLEEASKVLKAAFRATTVDVGLLKFQGKDFSDSMDTDKSFIEEKLELEKAFKVIEEEILKNTGSDRIVVFIDDLDRCSPENVLALITTIKLFFTLSKRMLFVFGVDKKAVVESVKLKYGEVMDSSVYLEKVFDITFNLPQTSNLNLLVKSFFYEDLIGTENYNEVTNRLSSFFTGIGFTNPRHVKKVMNKFFFLSSLETYDSNPKINIINGVWSPKFVDMGAQCENLILLYLLIIHDYYNELFKEMHDFDSRASNYTQVTREKLDEKFRSPLTSLTNSLSNVKSNHSYGREITFKELRNRGLSRVPPNSIRTLQDYTFAALFLPFTENGVDCTSFDSVINSFDTPRSKICVNFIRYMRSNNLLRSSSDQKIIDLFDKIILYS